MASLAQFRTFKEPINMVLEGNSHIDQVLLEASRMIGKEKTLGELVSSPADNAVMAALTSLAQVFGPFPLPRFFVFTILSRLSLSHSENPFDSVENKSTSLPS